MSASNLFPERTSADPAASSTLRSAVEVRTARRKTKQFAEPATRTPTPGTDRISGHTAFLPVRRSASSLGFSAVIHAVLLFCLSLLMIELTPQADVLSSVGRFDDGPETGAPVLIDAEPAATTLQNPVLDRVQPEQLIVQKDSLARDQIQVDLSAFRGQGEQASDDGIGQAAASIQNRVAAAGGKTGEVQFSLAWKSFNDLDLHVIAPSGEHISWRHRESRCRGVLDVDMNVQPATESPVENIRWLARSAPMGRYTVIVHQFRRHTGPAADEFQLLVNMGKRSRLVEGRVRRGSSISVHRFQHIRSNLSEQRQKELSEELTALQEREELRASELLESALVMVQGTERDEKMRNIILKYPHTDAALRAMQELQGDSKGAGD